MTVQAGAAVRLNVAARVGLGAGLGALLVDQLTKTAVVSLMTQPPRSVPLTSFLTLGLTYNSGISFGLVGFIGESSRWYLTLPALAIVGLLAHWMWRTSDRWESWSLGAVAGGMLGNVVDRVRRGWIPDFIEIEVQGYPWPMFNMADAAIAVGAIALLARSFRMRRTGS